MFFELVINKQNNVGFDNLIDKIAKLKLLQKKSRRKNIRNQIKIISLIKKLRIINNSKIKQKKEV